MGWGNRVKLRLAFLAVFGEEVLQVVNEAIGVAGSSLIRFQSEIELSKGQTYA